jgi:CRISPR-associated protein Csm1
MLIVGDLSGIQEFVFALPEEEGGQARMLRARSFYVQALSEVLAWRVQRALELPRETLLFCAAGKFALQAESVSPETREKLRAERAAVEEWLLAQTGGALRYALALEPPRRPDQGIAERYDRAMAALQAEKHRPWSAVAVAAERWAPERLVLTPVAERAAAERFRQLGKELPAARWLVVTEQGEPSEGARFTFELAGCRAALYTEAPPPTSGARLVADLQGGGPGADAPAGDRVRRPLARHVPRNRNGTLMLFEEIAPRARGAPYLGVLKMDADSLGVAVRERLSAAGDLRALARFSGELDDLFALELDALLRTPEWESIYTVFSGGDDLLLVGPWDVMLDFAGEAWRRFTHRFGGEGLTISGGLAVVRYRLPIRQTAAVAEGLLERAKTEMAPGARVPKDQLAALGQLWKWEHHPAVLAAGKRLAGWVAERKMERGWLQTMLDFALLQRGDLAEPRPGDRALAASRLAYHVERNYPRQNDRDPARRDVREWAERVLAGFDAADQTRDPEVLYLPAILRYALLATRSTTREESP